MKRILFILLFISIIFFNLRLGFADIKNIEIGLAWVEKAGMPERVTNGFKEAIKELAPDIQVEYQKELPSFEALTPIIEQWEKEKKAIILLRSNGAEWLKQHPTKIPTFIGACNHPAQIGVIKNLKSPEGNITGVTYFLPAESQFDIYKAIIPNLKSVLLLVEAGHPGAAVDREETSSTCKKFGINYHDKVCTSLDDALEAVNQFKGNVSAIIFGNQALLLDNAEKIIASGGNTPFLSYDSRPVKAGALGGFVADDIKLGYMLAESVVDVLKNGKPIKDVPVKMDPNPKFFVNVKTAQSLGIDIPFDILAAATIVD